MANSLRVPMRLSTINDIDLIVMAQTDKQFQKTTQAVIQAYLQGEKYPITLPEIKTVEQVKRNIFFRFSQPEIIDWLLTIPNGRRSVAIKSLLKQSITNPIDSFFHITLNEGDRPKTIAPAIINKKEKSVPKTTLPAIDSTPVVIQPTIITNGAATSFANTTDPDKEPGIFDFI